MKAPTVGLLVLLLVVPLEAGAALWQSTNVQVLYGEGYKLNLSDFEDTEARNILTLQHANAWRYGDNFFFFDTYQAFGGVNDQAGTDIYGELHPRLSGGKIFDCDLSLGPISDILLAGELNFSRGWRAYFYGLGFDLDLPRFKFFAINFFVRDDDTIEDDSTFQISPSWSLPFVLGETRWEFGGFLDYAGSEGVGVANLLAQPHLLLDVGRFWAQADTLWLGIEYQYWQNKFGIDGLKESFVQFTGVWVF